MFLRYLIVIAAMVAVLALTPAAQAQTASRGLANSKMTFRPVKVNFDTSNTTFVKNVNSKAVRVAVPTMRTGSFTKRIAASSRMVRPVAFKGVTAKKSMSNATKASVSKSRNAFRGMNNKVFVKTGSTGGKIR